MPSFKNTVVTKFTAQNSLSRVLKKMGDDGTRMSRQIKKGNDLLKRSFVSVKNVAAGMVIGKAITVGAAALRNQVGGVVQEFIDFDHALGMAAAKLDVIRGSDAWKGLEKEARALGGSTEFTNTQVAKSIDVLAMAGFKYNQILASMAGAADLATIGNLELNDATQIAVDTLNSFGMRFDDPIKQMKAMTHATDVIARVATSSAVTVEQFHKTISMSGWAANAAKSDVGSYATLVGLLGDSAIRGSNAATIMKNAYLGLTGMTPKAAKRLKQLGIQTEYVSDAQAKLFGRKKGDLKNAVDLLADMSTRMESLGNAERLRLLKDLFGKYGAGIEGVLKLGSNKITEFRDKYIEAGRTAKQVADDIRDSLANKLKVIESKKIELGFRFLDKVKDKLPVLVDRFGDFIASIDVDKVIEKGKRIVSAVESFVDVLKTLKPVIISIGVVLAGVKIVAFVAALKAATVAAIAFAATPLGMALLAISIPLALLISQFDSLGGMATEIKESFSYAFDQIKKKLIDVMLWMNDALMNNSVLNYLANAVGITDKAIQMNALMLKNAKSDGALFAGMKYKNSAEYKTLMNNKKYSSVNYYSSNEKSTVYEPWLIDPPNRNELSMRGLKSSANWKGTLTFENAPNNATFKQSSQGAPPLSVEGLGVPQ